MKRIVPKNVLFISLSSFSQCTLYNVHVLILYTYCYCCLSLITKSEQLFVHLVCICVFIWILSLFSIRKSVYSTKLFDTSSQYRVTRRMFSKHCSPLSTHYILCSLEQKSKNNNNGDDTLTLLSANNKFV